MAEITIPTPCSEDFSKMSAVDKGFHCDSCQKVVIDFTSKSDEEITTFLRENQGKKTCGRFRISQVVRHRTFSFQIVRFAAAILLAFGSFLFAGCNDPKEHEVMGEMCVPPPDSTQMANLHAQMVADSTRLADSFALLNDTMQKNHSSKGK